MASYACFRDFKNFAFLGSKKEHTAFIYTRAKHSRHLYFIFTLQNIVKLIFDSCFSINYLSAYVLLVKEQGSLSEGLEGNRCWVNDQEIFKWNCYEFWTKFTGVVYISRYISMHFVHIGHGLTLPGSGDSAPIYYRGI